MGRAGETVEREDGNGLPRERRVTREARGAERAVRAGVDRQEDERVERGSGRLRRPGRRVGAGELHEGRGPARVRVRPGGHAVVVTMSNDHDRLAQRPRDDRGEVPELDAPEPGDVLAPSVLADAETVEGELVPVPLRGGCGARGSGDAVRVVARELGRQGRGGRAVEGGRQVRSGKRTRARHREDDEHDRKREQRGEVADEPEVDGPLDRAAPRPPLARAEAGGLHAGGYSRGRAGPNVRVGAAPTISDAGLVLDHSPRGRRGRHSVAPHVSARARRLQGRPGARRRRGAEAVRGRARRPRRPRHHAAKSRRSRGVQTAPLGEHRADHHVDRPRRRARQGARVSSSGPTTTSRSPSRSGSSGAACVRCSAVRPLPTMRAAATR